MVTVNPVVSENGTYLGSEIESIDNSAAWKNLDQEYVETPDGRIAHRFQDVELEDEQNEGHFNFTDYAVTLRSAYPDLDAAIAWAAQSGAPGFDIIAYNNSIDNQDLEEINAGADRLISLYYEALEQPPTEDQEELPDELDSWFEENITDAFIDEAVETISNAEFSYEEVEQMQQLQDNYEQGSPESFILDLGVAIGNGELSGEDAIQYALQHFSEAQLAKAYVDLQSILND